VREIGSCDIVLMMAVFEQLDSPLELLSKILKYAKGLVILVDFTHLARHKRVKIRQAVLSQPRNRWPFCSGTGGRVAPDLTAGSSGIGIPALI